MKLQELKSLISSVIKEENQRPAKKRKQRKALLENRRVSKIMRLFEDKISQAADYEATDGQLKKSFDELSKSLNASDLEGVISILNSPVMKTKQAKEIFKNGLDDGGEAGDDKIEISEEVIAAKKLQPSQGFIDCMQSVAFPLSNWAAVEGAKKSELVIPGDLLAVSGNMILDGHHRWSGTLAINPDANLGCRNFKIPGDGGKKLATLQVAIASRRKAGTNLPSKSGSAAQDILGQSAETINGLISQNVGSPNQDEYLVGLGFPTFFGDEWVEAAKNGSEAALGLFDLKTDVNENEEVVFVTGSGEQLVPMKVEDCKGDGNACPLRKHVISVVSNNLAGMKDQASGTPATREPMPQLDHKELEGGGKADIAAIVDKLPKGEINVSAPYIKEKIEESIDVNRWNKLAGLLKD